ncbi:MAG: hypothetical protein KKD11_06215, partial [Candidatus Omnitrophica bacterium]|nr:hypothetical protein [Candidatus Omnitrophota bacterium]
MIKLELKKYKGFDWVLMGSALGIFALGLLFLFSATYPYEVGFVLRQVVWFLLGSLIFMWMININYRKIVGIGNIF